MRKSILRSFLALAVLSLFAATSFASTIGFASYEISPDQISSDVISTNKTVGVWMPYSTDLTGLVASFDLNDTSADVYVVSGDSRIPQTSGSTSNDFTNGVKYYVVVASGELSEVSEDWTVTVSCALPLCMSNDITAFTVSPDQVGKSRIDSKTHTVNVDVLRGTDLTSLSRSFGLSPGAVAYVGGVPQSEDWWAQDFRNPVTYTVVAEEPKAPSRSEDWTVTVRALSYDATRTDIVSFDLPDQVYCGINNPVSHSVYVLLPWAYSRDADRTALVPRFRLSPGAEAYVSGDVQYSGVTSVDFSGGAVTYKVIAQNGVASQDWSVTVSALSVPRMGKDIVSFYVPDQIGSTVIDGSAYTVRLTMPYGTSVTALKPTFTLSSGARAFVGATAQVSGTTSNDFTNPVVYTVLAGDFVTSADWTVTVALAAAPTPPTPPTPTPPTPTPPTPTPPAPTPEAPDVTPVELAPVLIDPDKTDSETGAVPLEPGKTLELVNGNKDVKEWFDKGNAVLVGAAELDGTRKDIRFQLDGKEAGKATHVGFGYDGTLPVTPLFVQGKRKAEADEFDISLPAAQIKDLMAADAKTTLAVRLALADSDAVVLIGGRNLVAEGKAVVKQDADGTWYMEMVFSNRVDAPLTFRDLSGTLLRLMATRDLEDEIIAKIIAKNYVYQDLVNLGIERLSEAKFNEYKVAIDRLSPPDFASIQDAVDHVNSGGTSSGSSGCSMGFSAGALLLVIPALLMGVRR